MEDLRDQPGGLAVITTQEVFCLKVSPSAAPSASLNFKQTETPHVNI